MHLYFTAQLFSTGVAVTAAAVLTQIHLNTELYFYFTTNQRGRCL